MKSHGTSVGLMGLRLMEGSPTSPTTLQGGTSGTNQAGTALADEAEIGAAVEVARSDWPQWRAA